jgi:hypothetical protein
VGASPCRAWRVGSVRPHPGRVVAALPGVGGTASPARVAAYARGRLRPDSYQHNLIAQAINEHFTDLGEDHPVSYQDIPSLP